VINFLITIKKLIAINVFRINHSVNCDESAALIIMKQLHNHIIDSEVK